MVVPLAGTPLPTGRTGRARTRVSVATGDRQALATATLREAANRQGPVTGEAARETPATVARESATRVRIVAEAETVSATATFPVAAVEDLVAPAHSAAVPKAAHGPAVPAAHPAWAVPGAVREAGPEVAADGAGE